MTTLTYKDGIEINQVTRQQITLRGKGDGAFAFAVNKEVSLLPPSDNLRMVDNDRFIFAKQSFDQWVLIAKNKEDDQEILRMVSEINKNDTMLASNYSEGQSYFEISGEDKDHYLNKLTHFDFHPWQFLKIRAIVLLPRVLLPLMPMLLQRLLHLDLFVQH